MQLVKLNQNKVPVMSSMELAEFTGKRHDNLMRDIKKMFDQAGIADTLLNFEERRLVKINDHGSKEYRCYEFPEKESLFIASKTRDDVRWKIICEFEELKKAQVPQVLTPAQQMRLVADYMDKQDALEAEVKSIGSDMKALEDKVDKLPTISTAPKVTHQLLKGYISVKDAWRKYCSIVSYEVFKEFIIKLQEQYPSFKLQPLELVTPEGNIAHTNQMLVSHAKDVTTAITSGAKKETEHFWSHPLIGHRFKLKSNF